MNPTDRILDANLNRAREALRVMEDYARLGLDDASLAAMAKDLRHRLADAAKSLGVETLIAARDILGDVGRTIATEQEYERSSLADVAAAAGKRLTEALRVLEEVGKLRSRPFAQAIEALRYAAYDLEMRIAMRNAPASRFEAVRLYVLITEALCSGPWLTTAEAALRGGADALQLREKELPDGEFLDRARTLSRLCRDKGALWLVNDRPDIAALAGADGVHVGQGDLPIPAVRRLLPEGSIVGLSTHDAEQVRCGVVAGPDYIAIGPMFPSATKAIAEIPGPSLWTAAREHTSLPLVAIGGITPDRLPALAAVGCDRVCVCQAVIGEKDVEAAARRMRRSLDVPAPSAPLTPV